MITRETIFQSGDKDKIWKRFCGFLDLSVEEFMAIQRRLLEEQLEVVGESPLWKKLLNGKKPKTMEEFREVAPITTYWTHYADYIGEEGKDQYLATKPLLWAHSSGRGGRYKWIPWTKTALERYGDGIMAGMLFACADRKGEVKVQEGFRILCILAPPPYISGITGQIQASRFNLHIIPPMDISTKLEFQERIQLGFKLALKEGVDFVGALSTVLVKVGAGMTERSQGMSFSPLMLRPSVAIRMLRALVNSKREKRPILPSDLWPVKGISCGGTDTSIYREKLKYYWGRVAHEMYIMTECGIVTMQSWTKKDMTFYPYLAFLEFIPEEDWLKSRQDSSYRPRTVLINELEVGKIYEVVITNFYGMSLMRYRPGDLIKVTALEDKRAGIKLPQVIFYSRADGLIDLYSIVKLDERTVWQAIDNTGFKYEDWSARKEYKGSEPILRIYIELKENADTKNLESLIHEQLIKGCHFYEEAIGEMQTNPIQVTLLQPGSFQRYYDKKRTEGADLAHLKPPHMNTTDEAIKSLSGD
ncbi:MAG: GH3 auxin-responsive promoter family protein [Dehalococcoidia bacterium]|nr:GH3 auxin-responsive promoter family protein [Dehalococcoidia bacterium]